MNETGQIRIGISGWRYAGWRRVFYPPRLQQRRELEFAATKFSSVEINGTFYSLQRPSSFRQWAAATPADFLFAVKGPRYITHMLKLRNAQQPLANFFANGLLELGPKLGPILWQFPPQLRFDRARFEDFFALLPRTLSQAASLARLHDSRLDTRSTVDYQRGCARGRIRHCIEIRHESFATPEVIALLRRHDIGLVVADTVAWPLLTDVTSDFVYVRLHGSIELYASGYESDALDIWADRILTWARGDNLAHTPTPENAAPNHPRRACTKDAKCRPRDVFVYFDNDAKVRAPFDAQALQAKIDQHLQPSSNSKLGPRNSKLNRTRLLLAPRKPATGNRKRETENLEPRTSALKPQQTLLSTTQGPLAPRATTSATGTVNPETSPCSTTATAPSP